MEANAFSWMNHVKTITARELETSCPIMISMSSHRGNIDERHALEVPFNLKSGLEREKEGKIGTK
jgi:hypothetical protein